ncbi:MAG: methylated-DNA--[protein]-cysteine S-methyltransferase [Propionibacteriaceae bacterium]|jgi:methylated-DNA-[protein]-cysteine S-methyltransferase|nr:methylated-DNA--[protein]-cysteine S-methyltransferase [Propionibacteriaceae bacterium]
MLTQWVTLLTPDGTFGIVANSEGVLAAGWTDDIESLVALIHPSRRPDQLPRSAGLALDSARAAVEAYYAGDLAAPMSIPICQTSSPFRLRVWEALRTIPAGQRLTYTDLATRAGNALAIRAAGSACALNPAALFQPCHRIVRRDGKLGGFRYGLPIKAALLAREA